MKSYEDAVQRICELQALDTEEINPLSYTSFLTHERKTERAILLLHGYTSSPRQYVRFADEFFKRGYNVLIPRFPHHGHQDRMTPALQNQTEAELIAFTQNAVDILSGLGNHVTVAGFSMGGILALWTVMNRPDVSLACVISPALAYHAIPLKLTSIAIQAYLRLPNQFNWWDEDLKDAPLPPLHAYPRYGTRGLAHVTNIGLKIRSQSRHTIPKAGSVLVVTNPTDESVNNAYASEIVENWRALGFQDLRHYEFDPKLKLRHDLMDPEQTYQQVDVVYPILLNLITEQGIHT